MTGDKAFGIKHSTANKHKESNKNRTVIPPSDLDNEQYWMYREQVSHIKDPTPNQSKALNKLVKQGHCYRHVLR